MNRQLKQLEEFHRTFGLRVANSLDETFDMDEGEFIDMLALRKSLIEEETKEVTVELVDDMDIPNVAKEIADLLYVTFGTIISLGLQDKMEEIFDEVHRSNMSKLTKDGKVLRREDGKVLKSSEYTPANIDKVLYK